MAATLAWVAYHDAALVVVVCWFVHGTDGMFQLWKVSIGFTLWVWAPHITKMLICCMHTAELAWEEGGLQQPSEILHGFVLTDYMAQATSFASCATGMMMGLGCYVAQKIRLLTGLA